MKSMMMTALTSRRGIDDVERINGSGNGKSYFWKINALPMEALFDKF